MNDETILNIKSKMQDIIVKNSAVYERGIIEASAERLHDLITDLNQVFSKHGLKPNYKLGLKAEQQLQGDEPLLAIAGINLVTEVLLKGKDRQGRDGNYAQADYDEYKRLQAELERVKNE